ncbi:unnamed protein product [Hymenolepis diminuta]|uniref:UBIQUITIN_CONJUGAT_2 domain-containing protein n=1 Tax=Hymenolepis diminuta TaxID=6216 RepID=A0A0R3SAQ9_HYMDI|nr:unnamed protein product [Hymenolepis diminuta]VUZ52467.1 unnamed protein product [Hymenolepis diminuta]
MADSVAKRLQTELMELMTSGEKGISGFPLDDNILKWTATIHGPEKSVYEGQVYKLLLEFPPEYPFKPPIVHFESRCYHPNIDHQGNICLDILKTEWSALYTVKTILLSIRSLLNEPNNKSPLNGEAAKLWPDEKKFKEAMLDFQKS